MSDYRQQFPRTFEWHEVWVQAIIRPVPEMYQVLLRDPKKSLQRALVWVLITGFITSTISVFWQALTGGDSLIAFVGAFRLSITVTGLSIICAPILVPILSVVSVIAVAVWSFVLHIVGHLLGGSGDYDDIAYLISSQSPLLGIVNSIVIGVPVMGTLVNAIIFIYSIGLQISAVKTVHQFGWIKAIATVALPFIVFAGLILCCVAVFFASIVGLS